MKRVAAPSLPVVGFNLGRSSENFAVLTNPYTGTTSYNPRGPGRFAGSITFASSGAPGNANHRALLLWATTLEPGDVTKLTLPSSYYAPKPAAPSAVAATVTATAIASGLRTITCAITGAGAWPAVGPYINVGERLYMVTNATGANTARVFTVWPNIPPATNSTVELAAPFVQAKWENIPAWGADGPFVLPLTLSFTEDG